MFARLKHRIRFSRNDADPHRLSKSGLSDSASSSQPDSKLLDKLQKLARWRIDPSSIEFPQDAREFSGGYATVSRAFLVSTSGSKRNVNDSVRTGGQSKSDGGTPSQQTVAVKKLKIGYGEDNERVLGLALREAGILTELSHENVIELEGFVEDLSENRVWLVFPWAANGNLKDFVASGDWEIPERIWLINDVARGVEYLHDQDPPIYHGDLKSANVLVNSECRAVITDFGSARRLSKNGSAAQPDKNDDVPRPALLLETEICEATNTITLTGNKYTLRWAAPELLMDDEPGLWSDIWALGWIFYEVMTNAIPFEDVQNDATVIVHVIQGNLPSVADHTRMALIRALYSLLTACWSVVPSKRPTAEDCRKSITWMPMITPDPQRASSGSSAQARSPELLMGMGRMHLDQGDCITASNLFNEALGICTDTANNAGKVEALFWLATVHQSRGEYSDAATLYYEAIQLWTSAGDRQGKGRGVLALAHVRRLQNRTSEAFTLYSEAAQLFAETASERGRANAIMGLAAVHQSQGHYSEAVPLLSEVVQVCTDLGDRKGRASALRGLADVNRLREQYGPAAQLFSEALQIYTDMGDRAGVASTLGFTAALHSNQGQHVDAIRLFEQAAGICEEIGNIRQAEANLSRAAYIRQHSNQGRIMFPRNISIEIH